MTDVVYLTHPGTGESGKFWEIKYKSKSCMMHTETTIKYPLV